MELPGWCDVLKSLTVAQRVTVTSVELQRSFLPTLKTKHSKHKIQPKAKKRR